MNQLQLLSPTTRLRKELRRRRREKKMGTSCRTTVKVPLSPIVTPKIHSRRSNTTTKKKKPPVDRSKTPLLTYWSSDSDDSELDWGQMKRRIRYRNAQRKKGQAPNGDDIDWGDISSDEESFAAILERRKLEMSTRKGTRRALQQATDYNVESTFGNLGFVDNHKRTISRSRRRKHTARQYTPLDQENLPQEVDELDKYEAQVYNSMKLGLRGNVYDSNRTLCELIRQRRNDVSFASRKAHKEDVALEDLQSIYGIGPYRAEKFGNEILDSLDSEKNTKLLKLSRKKGMVRFGVRIDKAMKRLEKENGTQNIRLPRTQPKLKAVDDDDDDCSLPLPKYVAFGSQNMRKK